MVNRVKHFWNVVPQPSATRSHAFYSCRANTVNTQEADCTSHPFPLQRVSITYPMKHPRRYDAAAKNCGETLRKKKKKNSVALTAITLILTFDKSRLHIR